ncbi:trypsin-like peptidase domain-containing protein [Bacillus sp. FJAT-49732]|uniref:Trypsin-like peptidase domain-containing protein n=1 Tax=Lederbergia citrisecunda TaxID=2833583 RepID=A0A942TKM9_9BACI|nr:serine protease [Lederbergia citrisecunda]MBS4199860.1 trypsin-like peptidase domain-containing protein [Lederbergia citrisecunda]
MEDINKDTYGHVDSDLTEDIDDEEMYELVKEAQREALEKAARERETPQSKRMMPKWMFWLMATIFLFSSFSFFFEIYSIPAIEFLKTSTKLSVDRDIQLYKKSVVTIVTGDSKGTGFSISSDGKILTNFHVIDGNERVTVAFPDDGMFIADVVDIYPDVDLALLEINEENLPYLQLADRPNIVGDQRILFIGNPLRFQGIVNEGTIIDYIKLTDWEDEVVMIKAPVYRGNSGSPVLNEEGQVIGVVFATMKHEEYGKVGLIIPIQEFFAKKRNKSLEEG